MCHLYSTTGGMFTCLFNFYSTTRVFIVLQMLYLSKPSVGRNLQVHKEIDKGKLTILYDLGSWKLSLLYEYVSVYVQWEIMATNCNSGTKFINHMRLFLYMGTQNYSYAKTGKARTRTSSPTSLSEKYVMSSPILKMEGNRHQDRCFPSECLR